MSYKYTAIIIEPRIHKALPFVLHNFLENLSEEWGIIIFHGNKNKQFVYDLYENIEESQKNRIQMIDLRVDNLNRNRYSNLFKTKDFYHLIPTETFLVFQTDTLILKENKHKINDFLEYDYVGAPWRWSEYCGNGGLSLRKKSKMMEIIDEKGCDHSCWEDIYFTTDVKMTDYKRPCKEEAKQFSVETIFYLNPFGIHNCWRHLQPDEMKQMISKYKDIQTLIQLNM
jgi:hypothetical protein